ncbi:MAG: type II toxin-antitoxin system VapC family toxin [Thermodesulfobacteriota bacterium]
MNPIVYLETMVVSYLTGRPSRDLVVAAHQQLTRDWWESSRDRYEVVASELVVREAGAGDPGAAESRLAALKGIPLLGASEPALALARRLVAAGAIPADATEDALHIAIAVTNGADYLLTWNCRHLANAVMRQRIEDVCEAAGNRPVVICTPEELMEA